MRGCKLFILSLMCCALNPAARAQTLPVGQWQISYSNNFSFFVGGPGSNIFPVGASSQTGSLSQPFSFAAGQYTMAFFSSGTTTVPGSPAYMQLVTSVGGSSVATFTPEQNAVSLFSGSPLNLQTLSINIPSSGLQNVIFAFMASPSCSAVSVNVCGAEFDYNTVTLTLVSLAPITGQLPSSLPTNLANVASAIDTIGPNPAAYPGAVLSLLTASQQQMLALLPQFTGEVATGAQQGGFALMSSFLNGMHERFNPGRNGFDRAGPSSSQTQVGASYLGAPEGREHSLGPSNVNTWGTVYRGYSRNDGDAATGTSERTVRETGFITGADVAVSPNSVAGVAIAGGRAEWGLNNGLGSGDGDAVQVGGYFATRTGPIYLIADAAYAHTWFDTDRSVLGILHTGEFEGQTYGTRSEMGYVFHTVGLDLAPYAAFQGMWFTSDGYTEVTSSGLGAPLTFAKVDVEDLHSELGFTISKDTIQSGNQVRLEFKTAWVHRWGDAPIASASFAGLPRTAFTVLGAVVPDDTVSVGFSAEAALGGGWTFAGKIAGEFGSESESVAGGGSLTARW